MQARNHYCIASNWYVVSLNLGTTLGFFFLLLDVLIWCSSCIIKFSNTYMFYVYIHIQRLPHTKDNSFLQPLLQYQSCDLILEFGVFIRRVYQCTISYSWVLPVKSVDYPRLRIKQNIIALQYLTKSNRKRGYDKKINIIFQGKRVWETKGTKKKSVVLQRQECFSAVVFPGQG